MTQTNQASTQLNNQSSPATSQQEPTLDFYVYPEMIPRCRTPEEANNYIFCNPINWRNFFDPMRKRSSFTVYRMVQGIEGVDRVIGFPQAEKTFPDRLAELQQTGTNCRLECYIAAIDVDNPGHAIHTKESLEKMKKGINDLSSCQVGEHLGSPHLWYITEHGFRLIYVLADPIAINSSKDQEFSSKMRTLKNDFQEHFDKYVDGLDVDSGITQWHRVYIMPNCPLKKSYSQPDSHWWYSTGVNETAPLLNLKGFRPTYKVSDTIALEKTDAPDPHECFSLLQNFQNNTTRVMNTVIGRILAQRLSGTEAYQSAFNPQYYIATERNNTLFRIASQAIGKLFGKVSGLRKEHIFGLGGVSAYELGEDDDGIPWTEKFWDMICRMWAEKEETSVVIEQQRQELSVVTDDVLSSMFQGVSNWGPKEFLESPESETAKDFIRSHLFCCVGSSFFPLGNNGYYEEVPLVKATMRAIFKNRPIGKAVAVITEKGEVEYPNNETIIGENCTLASHIHYVPNIAGSYIDNVDQTSAELNLRTYRLDPSLEAEFNPDVDAWLQAVFGDHYELANRWIAYSLDFSNPICVLSIQSEPGAGKKLLVQGLAECLEIPSYCTGDEVLGVFNDSLALTPWVWVDEGWPKEKSQSKAAGDVIRRWTGGGKIPVKKMYTGQVKVTNPIRFIFTANNEGVVRELSRGTVLSPEDRRALEERVLHMRLGSGGKKFLESRGGRAFTKGWIDKDGSDGKGTLKGNKTVAKHFKFLFDNRYSLGKPGARYLVSGLELKHNPVVNCLLTGGATPLVLEVIWRCFTKVETNFIADSSGKFTDSDGLEVDVMTGRVAITPYKIQSVFRSEVSALEKRGISIEDCSNVLSNFSFRRENSGYYLIDCKLLNNNLTKKGMGCKLIQEIADIQQQLGLNKAEESQKQLAS